MREDPQIRLRVPVWLKDKLQQSAAASGRSVNSEITLRLQASYMGDVGMDLVPSAEFARFLANQVKVNDFNAAVMRIIEMLIAPALKLAILQGSSSFKVDIGDAVKHYYKEYGFMGIDIVNEVVSALQKAGYEVVADSTEILGKF